MPIEITVPRLGWSMDEGTFVGWLKKDGDRVRVGEPLFTLDGDKALQEIEATDGGILRVLPQAPNPGSTVRVGDLLGYLLAENESASIPGSVSPCPPSPTEPTTTAAPGPRTEPAARGVGELSPIPPDAKPRGGSELTRSATRKPAISPRARRVASELGVEWLKLAGSGRSGRIRERDVRAAARMNPPGDRESHRQGHRMTVVVTDWTFPDLDVEEAILKSDGHAVAAGQGKSEADLVELCADADAVITQFARLNANVIAAMSKARAIIRYGIGVDNVDLEAASARGIPVCNVPDYCIDEVADQTLAFILALTRQIVPHNTHVHGGNWGLATPLAGFRSLRDLTVGVVGFGRIGREVVRRLLPFKCAVRVFDPAIPGESIDAAGATGVSLGEVLASADVLTLHCPSTAQTRKMISAEAIAQLKRGALFINVARGDLVDTSALVAALESGHVAAAALDVFDPEPLPPDHPLRRMRNVVLAPHIASCSVPAVKRLRETVARLAAAVLRGEPPQNVVNGVTKPRLVS
jgi:D-3-phosphoglycerate dehydrogenase